MGGSYDVLLTNGERLSIYRYADDINRYSFSYGCEAVEVKRIDLINVAKAITKTLAIKED